MIEGWIKSISKNMRYKFKIELLEQPDPKGGRNGRGMPERPKTEVRRSKTEVGRPMTEISCRWTEKKQD